MRENNGKTREKPSKYPGILKAFLQERGQNQENIQKQGTIDKRKSEHVLCPETPKGAWVRSGRTFKCCISECSTQCTTMTQHTTMGGVSMGVKYV